MKKLILSLIVALLAAVPVSAQTYLSSTTLSAAVTSETATSITVASASGIVAGTALYIDHELLYVSSVSGTTLTVRRFQAPSTHASAAVVIIIPAAAQATTLVTHATALRLAGSCTLSNYAYLPIIDTDEGDVYLCRYIAAAAPSRVWAKTNVQMTNGQTSLLITLQ